MGSRADKLILPYRLFVEISVNTVGYSRRNQLLVIILRHLLVFFRVAHEAHLYNRHRYCASVNAAHAVGLLLTSVLESGCRTDIIRYLF